MSRSVHKRIHITGSHRSGTTLLCALMTTCFDIDVAVADEVRLRAPLRRDGRVVLTKCTDESDYALLLLPLDPDLHVVQMVRDPRDVIVSKYGNETAYFTNIRSWRRNLPRGHHQRAHVVSYEELVTRPDDVQRELAAAMPFLSIARPFSAFSERASEMASERDLYWPLAMHSIRPPGPESIGRWRHHLARVKGQIQRHGDISDELIRLGLETNRNWLALLDGIEPDLTASQMLEDEPFKAKVTRTWRNVMGIASYVLNRRQGPAGSAS